jgi:tripeptidyl-peptidase-1
VWNDQAIKLASTGGYSKTFTAPPWQSGVIPVDETKRGVPDVSAHADSYEGALGTSVAAPLWAAWVARINQIRIANRLPRLGLAAPLLYANRQTFRDITVGDNGRGTLTGTPATVGWDAATGLGVPTGETAAALSGERRKEIADLPKLFDHKHWKPEIDVKPIEELVRPGDPPPWVQALQAMARGLDELTREVGELRAFIRAQERPPIGDEVIARSARARDRDE